jgi:hypothetical protein
LTSAKHYFLWKKSTIQDTVLYITFIIFGRNFYVETRTHEQFLVHQQRSHPYLLLAGRLRYDLSYGRSPRSLNFSNVRITFVPICTYRDFFRSFFTAFSERAPSLFYLNPRLNLSESTFSNVWNPFFNVSFVFI